MLLLFLICMNVISSCDVTFFCDLYECYQQLRRYFCFLFAWCYQQLRCCFCFWFVRTLSAVATLLLFLIYMNVISSYDVTFVSDLYERYLQLRCYFCFWFALMLSAVAMLLLFLICINVISSYDVTFVSYLHECYQQLRCYFCFWFVWTLSACAGCYTSSDKLWMTCILIDTSVNFISSHFLLASWFCKVHLLCMLDTEIYNRITCVVIKKSRSVADWYFNGSVTCQ